MLRPSAYVESSYLQDDGGAKKRTAVQPFGCNGRPTHGPVEVGAFAAVLLQVRRRRLIYPSVGRTRAPALIPRPAGRLTWFIRASAAGLVGSRTDLPHCTPRRQIGADGARDWLQLSGSGGHRDLQNRPVHGAPGCSSPDDPSGPKLSKQPLMSSASTSPWDLR